VDRVFECGLAETDHIVGYRKRRQ